MQVTPPEKTGPMPLPAPQRASAPPPSSKRPSKPPPPVHPKDRALHALAPIRGIVHGLYAHNAFEAAASIAFWFFLSLVPLLIFIGWMLGHLVRSEGIDALLQPALDIAPSTAEQLLRRELGRMAASSGAPIAPISVVGFLWTSSSGLHNLMDVFEIAVRVPRRPWWKQRAIALAWVVVGLATIIGSGWALVRIELSIHKPDAEPTLVHANEAPSAAPSASASPHERPHPKTTRTHIRQRVASLLKTPAEKAFTIIGAFAVGITLLAGFYRFAVEHPPGVRRRAFPGAFAAVVSWLFVSWAFGSYVQQLGNYAVYYGSVAAVAVLLVWLYLTSLTLVVGAEVNAQLEGVRD